MRITPTVERYILHWGEMGTRWGVNRTVSQIHALLYLSPEALRADEIAELLGVARSNVSTSLKELQSWNLVRVIHRLGDRRDHFEAEQDTCALLMRIVEERKKREIDPTLTLLRQCVLKLEEDDETAPAVARRIEDMLSFVTTLNDWYEQVRELPATTLVRLMKLGARVARYV